MKIKFWQFVGFEILLIIGMLVVSGCTSSDYPSNLSTPTPGGITTSTPVKTLTRPSTLTPTPTPTKWGGCTCTVYLPDQSNSRGRLGCHFSDGTVVSTIYLNGTPKDFNRYTEYKTCTYNGGNTCTCAEINVVVLLVPALIKEMVPVLAQGAPLLVLLVPAPTKEEALAPALQNPVHAPIGILVHALRSPAITIRLNV
jgi:hypothetical protein